MMTDEEVDARKKLLLSKGWKEPPSGASMLCQLENVIILNETNTMGRFPSHIKFVKHAHIKDVDVNGKEIYVNCLTRKMLGFTDHKDIPTNPLIHRDRWTNILQYLIDDLDNSGISHLYWYREVMYYDERSPYILSNYIRYAARRECSPASKNDKYYDFMRMDSW